MQLVSARIIRVTLAAALCVGLVAPSGAAAVTRVPATGFDLYDWVVFEGVGFARASGVVWPDLATAISQVEAPSAFGTGTCSPGDGFHDDIPAAVDELVDLAATQYASGDFPAATRSCGAIAHLLTDAQDPLLGTVAGADATGHRGYDGYVQRYLGAAWADHGWVPTRPARYVGDVEAEVNALLRLSALHRADSLRFGRSEAAGQIPPLAARQQLAARVGTAAALLGDLVATVESRAQRRMVPQSRWAGATRYETAVAASKAAFPAGADAVVVASGERWPDALAAAGLCGAVDAPLLLTRGATLPTATAAEIERLGARRVFLIGGEGVVSEDVRAAMMQLSTVGACERIAGRDRFATAFAVAERARLAAGSGWTGAAYVCAGDGFADALSASALAARSGAPILLAPRSGAADFATHVRAAGVSRVTVVGGTAVVAQSVADALADALGAARITRVAGGTRYATSARLYSASSAGSGVLALASGTDFPDGLSAGAAAGLLGGSLMLSPPQAPDSAVTAAIVARPAGVKSLAAAGGESVLSTFVLTKIQRTLDPAPVAVPAWKEWVPPVRVWYSHSAEVTSPVPTHTYLDGRGVLARTRDFPRDRNGILMISYYGRPAVYNPQIVSNYALACYEEHLHSGSQYHLDEFLKHAAWLRDTAMDAQGRLVYTFYLPERDLHAPWYSCISQGGAIQTFVRAWRISGDPRYLEAARRAYLPYTKEMAQGGVANTIAGELWLEEYPDRHQVLNGMIFAMWGLWDLYRVTGDPAVKNTFDRCASTVRNHLKDYESGGYILYERVPGRYDQGYHEVHVIQLRILSDITGDRVFANYADRWWLLPSSPWAASSSLGGRDLAEDPLLMLGFDPAASGSGASTVR